VLSELSKIIETLQELEQMHSLNLELLEQLNVACSWIVEHSIPIPNLSSLLSLLRKTKALLAEIQADEPKLLQYQKLADEKKHLFRTDEEGTESLCLSSLQLPIHRIRKCFNHSNPKSSAF
jgi:hypothetical protein